MSILTNFFGSKKTASRIVKIRTRRAMVLKIEGETQHVDAGLEIDLPLDQVRSLDKDDFTMLSKLSALDVPDPSPARGEPSPMPERWASLPESFAQYWLVSEQFRAAQNHIAAIKAKRIEIFGFDLRIGRNDAGTILGGSITFPSDDRNKNVFTTLKPIDLDDPSLRAQERYLTTAETQAEDYLQRLRETKFTTLQQTYFDCGQHLIQRTDILNTMVQELDKIGIGIFSTRVAALGLSDSVTSKLYGGSADFMKYHKTAPSVRGLAFGGHGDDGTQITYVDQPLPSIAGHLLRIEERIQELEPLLAEGRKELAKVRKAA